MCLSAEFYRCFSSSGSRPWFLLLLLCHIDKHYNFISALPQFSICMTGGLVIDWAGCSAITALYPAVEAQRRCCQLCHLLFRWFLISSCPWIRVSPPPAEDLNRLLDREKVCLLMNHTSFADSVLFVGTTPSSIIWRYRTLMKAGIFDVSCKIQQSCAG